MPVRIVIIETKKQQEQTNNNKKPSENNKCCKDVEKLEPKYIVGGKNSAATMENSMKFLKKLKIKLPYNPVISLLGM